MGDLTGQTVQLGDLNSAHSVVLTSAYDYNGDRLSLSANIGGTLTSSGTVSNGTPDFTDGYSYDNLGNMTGITQTSQDLSDANGVATKYVALGYDADSRLTGVSYFVAGTTNVIAASTYTYDHASRLTDLSYVDGSNNCLASYEWTYDNDSRVTQEESSADATIGSSWGVTNYGYDDDSQLTSTTYSTTFANAPTADTNSSPSYDSNGNRTNNGAAGLGNRLLTDGTYDYTYLCPGQVAGGGFVRPVCRWASQGTGQFNFAHRSMAA